MSVDRICDPGGEALIRKSPVVDFARGSVLLVKPGSAALVDINGSRQLYGPGRHVLDTGLSAYFGWAWPREEFRCFPPMYTLWTQINIII